MSTRFIKILSILGIAATFILISAFTVKAGPLSEFTIRCGKTEKCDMKSNQCFACTKTERGTGNVVLTILNPGSLLFSKTTTTFECAPSKPSGYDNCTSTAGIGGGVGDKSSKFLFFTISETEGTNCLTENLEAMYQSTCYSCVVITTLIGTFLKAGAKAYDVSKMLANVILTIATVLWLAMYILKSVSSFTTVEPMKMLQDIFTQLFKVMLAYIIVNSGIQHITEYTVVPLLDTGTAFGLSIMNTLGSLGG